MNPIGKRKIFNLYLDENHKNNEKKFIEFCEDKKIKISFMPKVFFKKLNLGLDQGFVCEIENYQYNKIYPKLISIPHLLNTLKYLHLHLHSFP